MTQFVLEQEKQRTLDDKFSRIYYLINQYAVFLNQPLTLGMFVPCDEEGELIKICNCEDLTPLEKKIRCYVCAGYAESTDTYQAAKERVLFEVNIPDKLRDKMIIGDNTVSMLISWEAELTPAALKQIGL
jgi:hypothetical protein